MQEKQIKIINYWVIPGIVEERFNLDRFIDNLVRLIETQTKVPISTRTRIREVCEGRQLACFILRKYNMSLTTIGKLFNVDHATVLHSVKVINDFIEYDKNFIERWLEVLDFAKIDHKPIKINKVELKKSEDDLPSHCIECSAYESKYNFCNIRYIKAYDTKPICSKCLKYKVKIRKI